MCSSIIPDTRSNITSAVRTSAVFNVNRLGVLIMRASLLEVVNTDYVRTARAKGLTEKRVTMKHAVRNALIPVVTLAALNFGALIGGAIVTEQIFQLDGMGNYFIQNLLNTDIYPIMAWLMVVAVAVIFFNLIADILYGVLDPRVRYD